MHCYSQGIMYFANIFSANKISTILRIQFLKLKIKGKTIA